MKTIRLPVAALLVFLALPRAAFSDASSTVKVVDDFNKKQNRNALSGETSAWVGDKTDPSIHLTAGFDERTRRGEGGAVLRLDYNIASVREHVAFPQQNQSGFARQDPEVQGTGFGGYTQPLMDLDATPYKFVSLWVRGDPDTGFTRRVRMELYDGSNVSAVWLEGIGPTWRRFTFATKAFGRIEAWKSLKSLTFVFDSQMSNKAGVLYLDDITFSVAPPSDDQ